MPKAGSTNNISEAAANALLSVQDETAQKLAFADAILQVVLAHGNRRDATAFTCDFGSAIDALYAAAHFINGAQRIVNGRLEETRLSLIVDNG